MSIICFLYVSTRNQTEVVIFGIECLKQLSGPYFTLKKIYLSRGSCVFHMSQPKYSNQRKTVMSTMDLPENELRSLGLEAATFFVLSVNIFYYTLLQKEVSLLHNRYTLTICFLKYFNV